MTVKMIETPIHKLSLNHAASNDEIFAEHTTYADFHGPSNMSLVDGKVPQQCMNVAIVSI